jgi:hypothetical protein
MADESVGTLDVRIEVETALAPILDLMRENNVLLRHVLEDLQELRARVETITHE